MFDAEIYNYLVKKHLEETTKKHGKPGKFIKKIRRYLDSVGYYMPAPLYRYVEDNITTWRFLESTHHRSEKTGEFSYKQVLNPLFNALKI